MAITFAGVAVAQTPITWDGEADSDYATGTNWVGDVAPADDLVTNIAQFTGGTVTLGGNRSVAGLDFDIGSVLDYDDTPGLVFTLGAAGIEVNGNSDIFGGELQFNQDTTVTLAGGRLSTRNSLLSGTGKLTVTGGNTLFIDATANTYSGGTLITAGATVAVKNINSVGSGAIELDGGNFQSNGSAVDTAGRVITVTANGGTLTAIGNRIGVGGTSSISGPGSLTIGNGSSIVFLDNANTFTGDFLVNGFASLKSAATMGDGATIVMDGGTLQTNNGDNIVAGKPITLLAGGGTFTTNGKRWSITDPISGIGSLTVDGGNNDVFLDVANSFTGEVTVKGTGSLGAKGTGTLGDNAGFTNNIFLEDGGTLFSNGASVDTGTRVINLVGTGGVLATNGARIGVGGIITGTGALTVGIGNNTVFLDNTGNDYSGGTIVQGLIRPKADGTLGDVAGVVTMDGGTLHPNQGGVTYPSTRNFILTALGGTFTSNGTTTFEGIISGAGDLIVNGTGTVILSGANTYTGNTSVLDGTLSLGDGTNDTGLADGATVIIEAPGILELNFSGTDTIGSLFVDGVQVDPGTYDMTDFPGIIIGNGSLEVTTGPGVPSIIDVEVDVSGNVILTLDGSEAGLTVQQSDDLDADVFSDVPSTSPGANQLQIDAVDVDPNADGADFYQIRN